MNVDDSCWILKKRQAYFSFRKKKMIVQNAHYRLSYSIMKMNPHNYVWESDLLSTMVRIELKNDEISSNSSWKQGSQFLFSTHLPVKIELI